MNETTSTPAAPAPAPVASNKISTKQILGFVFTLLVVAAIAFAAGWGLKKGQEVAA